MENDAKVFQCLALANTLGGLVLGGKRDAERVGSILQTVNNFSDFESRLKTGPVLDDSKIREELILWQKFDKKFFPDIHVGNYTSLRIPTLLPGFDWPIVNARGIGTNALVARMRKEFKAWTYVDDLDSVHSDRNPASSSYIVLVRPRIEADEELKNKSAEMLAEEAIPTITLPERLRLEFFYWWKTGNHLDVANVTLCGGSRYLDGDVPEVYWGDAGGELSVDWYDVRGAGGYLRARAVSA